MLLRNYLPLRGFKSILVKAASEVLVASRILCTSLKKLAILWMTLSTRIRCMVLTHLYFSRVKSVIEGSMISQIKINIVRCPCHLELLAHSLVILLLFLRDTIMWMCVCSCVYFGCMICWFSQIYHHLTKNSQNLNDHIRLKMTIIRRLYHQVYTFRTAVFLFLHFSETYSF